MTCYDIIVNIGTVYSLFPKYLIDGLFVFLFKIFFYVVVKLCFLFFSTQHVFASNSIVRVKTTSSGERQVLTKTLEELKVGRIC